MCGITRRFKNPKASLQCSIIARFNEENCIHFVLVWKNTIKRIDIVDFFFLIKAGRVSHAPAKSPRFRPPARRKLEEIGRIKCFKRNCFYTGLGELGGFGELGEVWATRRASEGDGRKSEYGVELCRIKSFIACSITAGRTRMTPSPCEQQSTSSQWDSPHPGNNKLEFSLAVRSIEVATQDEPALHVRRQNTGRRCVAGSPLVHVEPPQSS